MITETPLLIHGGIRSSLAKDPPSLPNDLRLLPTENWSVSRYLFIRDFDRDEWDAIISFYNKCELIDETIKFNTAAFWSDVEQIRINKQRVLADYAKDKSEKLNGNPKNNVKVHEEFDEITERVDTMYMGPVKTDSDTLQKRPSLTQDFI